jgi:hypothetical protein
MAEYKGIKGFKVQYLDQDPVPAVAGWSSGGNMGTTRGSLGGAGTQTAALGFGGFISPGYSASTEEYDGSSWTAGGNLGTARRELAGAGIQTAGLAIGGYNGSTVPGATEEYDGSAWTGGGGLGTPRQALAGCGIQTSALAFGGYDTAATAATEEYDGSTWTALIFGNSKILFRRYRYTNSWISIWWRTPPATGATEEYDGTSWTAGGSLNTARYGIAAAGIQTAALAFGGRTPGAFTGATEEYDGTSWTTFFKFNNGKI